MHLFRPPKPTSMTLNLAPMVDVMMCLIIFFLLGSTLVLEEGRPVELPYAISAQQIDPSEYGSRVVINVRPVDEATGEASYVVVGWDGRQIVERHLTPEQLRDHLIATAAMAKERGGVNCVIRADRAVEYRNVEQVLRACGLANITKVVFGTNPGTDPRR